MSEQPLSALESALGRLSPVGELNRDRLMFEAGRASARGGWLWPAATGLASLAALAAGFLLIFRPAQVVERVVIVQREVPAPVSPPVSPNEVPVTIAAPGSTPVDESTSGEAGQADYLRRRHEVLRWGVDVLPLPPPRSIPAPQPLTPGTAHEKLVDPSKLF
jgi:hypothetical protein